MKKYVFKRIAAIVIIFVMCSFLMADNSLGIKAVTADDVLVEESQVASEIGAENPTSEVEVITSEEAEKDVEEEISSNVIGEEWDAEALSSDVMPEEDMIVLASEEESYELSYGATTEKGFASYEAVVARIDEIGDADGVYTITCVTPDKDGWGNISNHFPDKAAELIFCRPTEESQLNYRADEYITTDIKLTFNTFCSFFKGCDLNEVVVNGTYISLYGMDGEETASTIDVLTLTDSDGGMPAYLGSAGEVRIGTCNFGTDAALSADVWFDEYNNARGAAHFIIDTLNLSEAAFELHMNREGYKSNHTVLTVPNNITMSNIINCQVGTWNLESLDNGDGTMSVKMIGKNYVESCLYVTDSSGNTVYEGTSWDELLNKFRLYGNKAETYTIKVAGETTIGALPSNAAKIILVCEGDIPKWEWAPRIKCSSATISVPVELEIQNATLAYGKYNDVVNMKLNGKTLILNDAYGIGNVSGGNGNIIVKEGAEGKVNKVDKLNTVTIYEGGGFAVMDSVTNVTTLRLNGILYSWGDITLNNILCDEVGEIHYDIEKKLTIKGTVTFDQGANAKSATIYLAPEIINGAVPERFEEGTVIVESGAKIKVSDFTLDNVPNYELDTEVENNVLYKEGNIIKIGIPAITVFDNHGVSWEYAEAEDGIPFVTINDAIDYVNGRTSGYYFIRLEQDIPSAGTIKTLYTREGKLVIICAKDETPYTLSFSGTFTVDGCQVEVENVELRNSAKSYASVVLKNYAKLTLCDTEINALTAPAGTKVIIANDENETVDVTINGTAKCSGDFVVEDGATLWCKSAVTVEDFTLKGDAAELRILTGKAFTIDGDVNIEKDSQLCINRVDKLGALASIKTGTAMVTAENATADQFCTENIQASTEGMPWLLTKSGKVIKTAYLVAYVYQPAEVTVNDKYYPFASFTEAKEFVASQDEYTPHYIELVRDSSGADLTNLPANLVSIRTHESATAERVKLTANTDIVLSRELEFEKVDVVASGKTVYGNSYSLWMSNSNLTAGKAVEVSEIAVGNGTVTLTAKTGNTINYVSVGEDATFKCPQFTGIEE